MPIAEPRSPARAGLRLRSRTIEFREGPRSVLDKPKAKKPTHCIDAMNSTLLL
jgi:hypothetical protein